MVCTLSSQEQSHKLANVGDFATIHRKETVMRIGIDFDSTIAKIDQPLLDRLNRERGTIYCAEDWSDWDLSFLPPEDKRLLFRLFTPDLYDLVLPYPAAPESISALSKISGVQLVCVTSNPQEDENAFTKAKRRWLRRHIPELSRKLIASRNKFGLGLDVLVDDAPHNHIMADCTTVLVRRPWNRDIRCPLEFSEWPDGFRVLSQLINDAERYKHERATYVC
jgi:5'(3')-deoxyribonucleotidase